MLEFTIYSSINGSVFCTANHFLVENDISVTLILTLRLNIGGHSGNLIVNVMCYSSCRSKIPQLLPYFDDVA